MAPRIDDKAVAVLVANEGVEQVDLTEPWKSIRHAGGEPWLVAPGSDSVQAMNHLDKADTFTVDVRVRDADPDDFDALVLPGGVANPDHPWTDAAAVNFVRSFTDVLSV